MYKHLEREVLNVKLKKETFTEECGTIHKSMESGFGVVDVDELNLIES